MDCPEALDLVGASAGQVGGSAAVSPEARSATMLWWAAAVGYPTGEFAGATAWGAASECPLIRLERSKHAQRTVATDALRSKAQRDDWAKNARKFCGNFGGGMGQSPPSSFRPVIFNFWSLISELPGSRPGSLPSVLDHPRWLHEAPIFKCAGYINRIITTQSWPLRSEIDPRPLL